MPVYRALRGMVSGLQPLNVMQIMANRSAMVFIGDWLRGENRKVFSVFRFAGVHVFMSCPQGAAHKQPVIC